ncbi:MAG: hypothetical protein JWO67_3821 [Streptosporangiaceae bacterium]|nr:hypothetical protein [Streptosporangiaceae bacterium]
MGMWISTGVGPFRVGRTFRSGGSPDPKSQGAIRLIALYFLLLLVALFVVPPVAAVLIIGFPVMFITAVAMEVKARRGVRKPGKLVLKLLEHGDWNDAQTQDAMVRRAHWCAARRAKGQKIDHTARLVLRRRPDLEYVIYPERRPIGELPFLTEADREWLRQHTPEV